MNKFYVKFLLSCFCPLRRHPLVEDDSVGTNQFLVLVVIHAARRNFNSLLSVWKCYETLSRVFDISSQSKLNLKSKRRNKIVKIYAN